MPNSVAWISPTWRPPIPREPSVPSDNSATLLVPFGQLTFNAEGSEAAGPYFSRMIHWPGGASGVTIGRGYDMGQRTRLQVLHELSTSGVPFEQAIFLSSGAGLRGEAANRFVRRNRLEVPPITLGAQRSLFTEIITPEIVQDVKRILKNQSVVDQYGQVVWEELCPQGQALLFDLRYRGDFTARTREFLMPLLVENDLEGLIQVMRDTKLWIALGVPTDRIARRAGLFDSRDTARLCA